MDSIRVTWKDRDLDETSGRSERKADGEEVNPICTGLSTGLATRGRVGPRRSEDAVQNEEEERVGLGMTKTGSWKESRKSVWLMFLKPTAACWNLGSGGMERMAVGYMEKSWNSQYWSSAMYAGVETWQ